MGLLSLPLLIYAVVFRPFTRLCLLLPRLILLFSHLYWITLYRPLIEIRVPFVRAPSPLRNASLLSRGWRSGRHQVQMEFYQAFWGVLGADLVSILNSCLEAGCLSLSQRRGIISLSFKKGDRLDPRNWHPITLLNVDYKLASWVIAGRLLKVIHLVVNKDQTCGVPGRFNGENVALLRDVIEYASSSDTPITILSLDQEKAFDRVLWSLLCPLWVLVPLSSLG